MNKNFLPKELESEYEKLNDNFFDFWNIQKTNDTTEFYLLGKFVFKVEKDLEPNEIISHMNLYNYIYHEAYQKGVKSNQEKIRNALGI